MIPDNCLMHVMNLCLNEDKKVNLNYLATEGSTKDKNQDMDFGFILLEKITFNPVINSIIRQENLCREGDFWNLRN